MNVTEFISQVTMGLGFNNLSITTEMQYCILVGSISMVAMVVEKVFGLFAIVLSKRR